jgi:hypothetical protein
LLKRIGARECDCGLQPEILVPGPSHLGASANGYAGSSQRGNDRRSGDPRNCVRARSIYVQY